MHCSSKINSVGRLSSRGYFSVEKESGANAQVFSEQRNGLNGSPNLRFVFADLASWSAAADLSRYHSPTPGNVFFSRRAAVLLF